jgi:hypothetical protein
MPVTPLVSTGSWLSEGGGGGDGSDGTVTCGIDTPGFGSDGVVVSIGVDGAACTTEAAS